MKNMRPSATETKLMSSEGSTKDHQWCVPATCPGLESPSAELQSHSRESLHCGGHRKTRHYSRKSAWEQPAAHGTRSSFRGLMVCQVDEGLTGCHVPLQPVVKKHEVELEGGAWNRQ